MHAPTNPDLLLDRADAALAEARQLRRERLECIAAGRAERRRAEQTRTFQSGLDAAIAISLLIRRDCPD